MRWEIFGCRSVCWWHSCSLHLCACAFYLWVSVWKGVCVSLYFWVCLGQCMYTCMRICVSAWWLYQSGGLCTSVSVFAAVGNVCLYICVSGFPRAGTSARSAWFVGLKGLRKTGAAITLNHSFASLASAPVEKCFKKQNKWSFSYRSIDFAHI